MTLQEFYDKKCEWCGSHVCHGCFDKKEIVAGCAKYCHEILHPKTFLENVNEAYNNRIVKISFNNWVCGDTYPNIPPFDKWMDDYFLYEAISNGTADKWAKEQKICIQINIVDQSLDLCITVPIHIVNSICPTLFNKEHQKFFYRETDKTNRFGTQFLPHSEKYYGINIETEDS